MVNNWLNFAHLLYFGTDCVLCNSPTDAPIALCAACQADLPAIRNHCPQCAITLAEATDRPCGDCQQRSPSFDHSIVPYHYAPPFNAFITGLKFNNRLASGRLMSQLLQARLTTRFESETLPQLDAIIPVPLHPARLRKRGFNQAIELARPLAKTFQLPLETHRVQRLRNTEPQSELKKNARQKNIQNAFHVDQDLPYRNVAILDDVITTGSTVNEFAKALKKAGVEYVEVWAVARA